MRENLPETKQNKTSHCEKKKLRTIYVNRVILGPDVLCAVCWSLPVNNQGGWTGPCVSCFYAKCPSAITIRKL